jgi:NAD(P)-dependent dehydrogenase (short-subunit alcohol dehydrogenase family)
MSWTIDQIPSQQGRTAVVTGSNTGLGLETAAELARVGARTVLACRTPAKATTARKEIRRRHPGADVEILELDLGDLAQISAAAAEATERFSEIHLCVNNAGVMYPPRSETVDGFELQFGTNHLGHFAWTGLVLPSLLAADGSRVVTVSSIAHRSGRILWDDLGWERRYSRLGAYGQSKLANLLFAFELQRRLSESDVDGARTTMSLAAHPGVSTTELHRHTPGVGLPGIKQAYEFGTRFFGQSAVSGAEPTLRAATDTGARPAEYYGPSGRWQVRGAPVVVEPDARAQRERDWARLWTISEQLTGVDYRL